MAEQGDTRKPRSRWTNGQVARVGVFGALLILLSACASSPGLAPVAERSSQSPALASDRHVVRKGETLYAIAWRYGVDYQALSRRNGIGKDYLIHPGQVLYLDVASRPVTKASSAPKSSETSISRTKVTKSPGSNVPAKPPKTVTFSHFQWSWPSQGKIIRTFSPKNGLSKGIDIEGRLGQPVLSAAPGTVVYAGDGLRGYGKLLIIKHSDQYLSAYAHNNKLLVNEGEVVKGSQKIAEIGSSGTDSTKLHFEIRREGKPVDPLQLLPKR